MALTDSDDSVVNPKINCYAMLRAHLHSYAPLCSGTGIGTGTADGEPEVMKASWNI